MLTETVCCALVIAFFIRLVSTSLSRQCAEIDVVIFYSLSPITLSSNPFPRSAGSRIGHVRWPVSALSPSLEFCSSLAAPR